MAMTFRPSAFRSAAIAAGLALTAGCAAVDGGAAGPRGTSVTRTHLGGSIARGEVSVEPRFETQAAGGVYRPEFGAAVADALRGAGFAPVANPTASPFVATVDVASAPRLG